VPDQAGAWGPEGHSIVAEIAQRKIAQEQPALAQKLEAILGPGRSLASIASWADDFREEHKSTTNWHFVDIPIADSTFNPATECKPNDPDGDCIIAELHDDLLDEQIEQEIAREFAVNVEIEKLRRNRLQDVLEEFVGLECRNLEARPAVRAAGEHRGVGIVGYVRSERNVQRYSAGCLGLPGDFLHHRELPRVPERGTHDVEQHTLIVSLLGFHVVDGRAAGIEIGNGAARYRRGQR
jgi:hypothetical protein